MSEDENRAATVFAAIDELKMFESRRGLGGGNFRDEMTFWAESVRKVRKLEQFRYEIGIAVAFPVGWVCKNEIVGGGIALEERKHIGFDRAAAIEFGLFQIFICYGDSLPMLVHKDAGGRATAEGFQAESS